MVDYLIAVLIQVGIYALMTTGLNLQFGYGGVVNFGVVAFYALGAYAVAILATLGASPLLCLLAVLTACAVLSIPIGFLTLRLRGDFLAIVMLGLSEVLRIVALNEGWLTGGSAGKPGIPNPFGPPSNGILLGLVLATNIIAVLICLRLIGSPFGRSVKAIRDDEDAFKALGKDPLPFRLSILVVGACLIGIAGAFQAYNIGYVSPDQFYPDLTFLVWIALILGGVGSITGAIGGAFVLFGLLEGSRFLRDFNLGIAEVEFASVRFVIIGLALVLLILYRSEGLFGRRI